MATKKDIFLKHFGAHLKALRLEREMRQADLANKLNKDFQSIQRVESGNINPSLYYLKELAEGLGITLAELIDFKIPEKKKK